MPRREHPVAVRGERGLEKVGPRLAATEAMREEEHGRRSRAVALPFPHRHGAPGEGDRAILRLRPHTDDEQDERERYVSNTMHVYLIVTGLRELQPRRLPARSVRVSGSSCRSVRPFD